MDRWTYCILDVFSNRPLAGNQLAVFEDAVDIPEHLLQPLAREIGFSETVYPLVGERARYYDDDEVSSLTPSSRELHENLRQPCTDRRTDQQSRR